MVKVAILAKPRFTESMDVFPCADRLRESSLSKSTSLFYFLNLKPDKIHLSEFRQHWDNMLAFQLTPKECSAMLHRTAHAFNELYGDPCFNALFSTLHEGIEAWEKRATETMPTFDARGLSNCLWAYATLGLVPQSKFLRLLQNQAEAVMSPNSSRYITRDVASSLWALAAISARTGYAGLRETAQKLHKCVFKTSSNDMDNSQIVSACLYFDFPVTHPLGEETATVSYREQRLSDVFRDAGLPIDKSKGWVSKLKHQADIAFSISGQLFMVEYDGPRHFIGTREGRLAYNNSTLLQSTLIQKCAPGATLLRVRYQEGDRLIAATTRNLLTRMLCDTVDAGKGVYETFTSQNGNIGIQPHLNERARRERTVSSRLRVPA
jgi:hypothetical protein